MQELQEFGWYLTEQGYNLANNFESIGDAQKIIKRAIDIDLREIGNGLGDITDGNLVLQIQKIRNIAAPKYNEESRAAPRMLKISLTDGKNNYQAIEIEPISGLGLNTPPGTKLLLKRGDVTMSHGILLLKSRNVARILGGKVANLVEKWELNRKLATHSRLRSVEEGGPPPWIPFGKKILKGAEKEKNFKALGKETSDKQTSEFEAQRQDAIAEAARLGVKKIFGGGNKQLLDHSVQRIVDQGFPIEQAEYALKINRNHVDRALKSLQRTSENRANSERRETREPREPRAKRFEKKVEETTKPSSGKVSLFDFLEDKLPSQNENLEAHGNSYPQEYCQRSENQFSDRLELRSSEYLGKGGGRGQKSVRGSTLGSSKHDKSKFANRMPNENQVSYAPINNFGNSNPGKAPRFQRHQDTQGNFHQHETKKNYESTDKCFQPNRVNESKNWQIPPGHDTNPHAVRQNRGHSETDRKTHSTNSNALEKNHKNQTNRTEPTAYGNRSETMTFGNRSDTSKRGNSKNFNNKITAGRAWVWKLGDDCMAKYWEDNRYYNARVTAVSATTCVVRFKDFDNYEEVLQADCIPITDKPMEFFQSEPDTKRNDHHTHGNRYTRNEQNENYTSGMEFSRDGGGNSNSRTYHRKRGQQRSAQPIYQPPAQRGQSSSMQ